MNYEAQNPGLSQFEEQNPVEPPVSNGEEEDIPLLEDLGISKIILLCWSDLADNYIGILYFKILEVGHRYL